MSKQSVLHGTFQEAHAIQSLFPEAQVVTGAQVSKATLRQVNAPILLHIATHGFFLQDMAENTTQTAARSATKDTRSAQGAPGLQNPLLRSGLALAGANLDKGTSDNGILTAREASDLNLWGTKLVTLSACDTRTDEPILECLLACRLRDRLNPGGVSSSAEHFDGWRPG